MEESFGLAIKEHLELKRRNRALESELPLEHYLETGATAVSPLSEDTQEWVLPEASTVLGHEPRAPVADELWAGTPAFDWGD